MSLKALIIYTFDNFKRHLKTNIMIIILLAIISGTLITLSYKYNRTIYNYNKPKELIDGDIKKLYGVNASNKNAITLDRNTWNALRNEINNIDGVKTFCSMPSMSFLGRYSGTDDSPVSQWYNGAFEKALSHAKYTNLDSQSGYQYRGIDVLCLDIDDLKLHKIKLSNGEYLTKEYIESLIDTHDYDFIYFWGGKITGVPENFSDEVSFETYYYACGIAEGEQFIAPTMFSNIDKREFNAIFVDLDYTVLELCSNPYCDSDAYLLMLENNCNFNDVSDEINTLASKYGYSLSFGSIASTLRLRNAAGLNYATIMMELGIVLSLACIMISVAIITVNFINDRSIYGVLLANGSNKRDIFFINLFEVLIRAVTGCYMGYRIQTRALFGNNVTCKFDEIIHNELINKATPPMLIIFFVIIILSSIVPYILIRKTSVVSLIEGRTR